MAAPHLGIKPTNWQFPLHYTAGQVCVRFLCVCVCVCAGMQAQGLYLVLPPLVTAKIQQQGTTVIML